MLKTVSLNSPASTPTFFDSLAGWTADYSWTKHGFRTCILFIIGVSVYDSLLVVWFRDLILDDERNPICELLILKDPSHLTWFLTGKFFGNVVVVATLTWLRRIGYKRTMAVTTGVALFQLSLLVFLTFSDPLTGFLHFDGLLSNDSDVFVDTTISLCVHLTVALAATVGVIAWKLKWKSIRNLAPQKHAAT